MPFHSACDSLFSAVHPLLKLIGSYSGCYTTLLVAALDPTGGKPYFSAYVGPLLLSLVLPTNSMIVVFTTSRRIRRSESTGAILTQTASTRLCHHSSSISIGWVQYFILSFSSHDLTTTQRVPRARKTSDPLHQQRPHRLPPCLLPLWFHPRP